MESFIVCARTRARVCVHMHGDVFISFSQNHCLRQDFSELLLADLARLASWASTRNSPTPTSPVLRFQVLSTMPNAYCLGESNWDSYACSDNWLTTEPSPKSPGSFLTRCIDTTVLQSCGFWITPASLSPLSSDSVWFHAYPIAAQGDERTVKPMWMEVHACCIHVTSDSWLCDQWYMQPRLQ